MSLLVVTVTSSIMWWVKVTGSDHAGIHESEQGVHSDMKLKHSEAGRLKEAINGYYKITSMHVFCYSSDSKEVNYLSQENKFWL